MEAGSQGNAAVGTILTHALRHNTAGHITRPFVPTGMTSREPK